MNTTSATDTQILRCPGAPKHIGSRSRLLAIALAVSTVEGCASDSPPGGTNGGSGDAGGSGDMSAPAAAAQLARKLGRPAQFLIGLGSDNGAGNSLGSPLDLRYAYLVRGGTGSWRTWNSPDGAYVTYAAQAAQKNGAIPLFTTYEMAALGDGNTSACNDTTHMTNFWDDMEVLFQRLAEYDDVAIVHFEPDWWGYVERASHDDPTRLPAKVTLHPRCSGLSDDAAGMARCLIKIAREVAPKAFVGFHYTPWGGYDAAGNQDGAITGTFLKALGAGDGDLVVTDAVGSDRDAGCWEAAALPQCQGRSGAFYLDESNTTSPNFHEQLALVASMHSVLQLPVVWWQMPLGVPGPSPGTPGHYRDNRVHYMFAHVDEFVAAGGLGACFGAGSDMQTDLTTDGGQFKTALAAYRQQPTALP